jgi:predicted nucleic acid-binding protein
MAVLLDTGILLRLWDRNDREHALIIQAVRSLYRQGVELVTSAQNIAEFWNVSTRPASARGGYGQSIEATNRRVAFLERFGRVLSDAANTYQEWRRMVVQYRVSGVSVHDARNRRSNDRLGHTGDTNFERPRFRPILGNNGSYTESNTDR